MRKITIFLTKSSIDFALNELRRLGVMHIEHLRMPHADYIDTVKKRLSGIDRALEIIEEGREQKKINRKEIITTVKKAIKFNEEKEKIKEHLDELFKERLWFGEWGSVCRRDLEKLASQNIFINLYVGNRKELSKIEKDELVYVVGQNKSQVKIAYISRNKNDSLPFKPVEPPLESFSHLEAKIKHNQKRLDEIKQKLKSYSAYRGCLIEQKEKLVRKLEYIKVKFGMAQDEGLACLQGFCPLDSVKTIKQKAVAQGWGVAVEKPEKPEQVPTLIRNPGWIEIIKPVFNFMGTLPGYKEYDISFWFLMFFSLFFAMLVGDAGYGLFFLAVTYFSRKKFKKAPPEPFFLFYLLSSATIVWGALSGTWFGSEAIAKLPFFNNLAIERINSFVQGNQSFMIFLSFIVGVVHLSIAHLIRAFRYLNSPGALAEIGWVCILWAAFFLAGNLVLNRPLPEYTFPLALSGVVGVLFFSNFQKNILKGVLSTLGTLPLDIVSSFSDIVSYLRLFAVGYATVAVASAFNNMAVGGGVESFWGGLLAAIVLFLGHSLNILLCLMSVIVHGIRLNMLEFSGQLGMEWSGLKYKPFK